MNWKTARLAVPLGGVLFCALLLSPLAPKLAASIAESSLNALTVKDVSGSLVSGLHVNDIIWEEQSVMARVSNLDIDLELSCLLTLSVCIDVLDINEVNIRLRDVQNVREDPPTVPMGLVSSPIELVLSAFSMKKFELRLADSTLVSASDTAMSLSFSESLAVRHFSVKEVFVALPDDVEAESTEPALVRLQTLDYTPPGWEPFSVPLIADIRDFSIETARITQEDSERFSLHNLHLAGHAENNKIELVSLTTGFPEGELSGSLLITNTYSVNGSVEVSMINHVHGFSSLSAGVEGSPADMAFSLEGKGKSHLSSLIHADLSSASLPVTGQISWQGVQFPTHLGETELIRGNVQLSGDLSEYSVIFDADNQVPELGKTRLTGTLLASLEHIELVDVSVDSPELKTLVNAKGKITDSFHWQSEIDIVELNTRHWSQDIEANLSGTVSASGYSDLAEDTDLNIDMNVVGSWQGYQADLKTRLNAKDINTLNIDTLALSVDDATVNMSGKASRSGQSDLSGEWDIPDLGALFEAAKGQTRGAFSLLGTPERPAIHVEFDVNNILVEQLAIGKGNFQGDFSREDQFSINTLANAENLQINGIDVNAIEFSLAGTETHHTLQFVTQADDWRSDLAARGSYDGDVWRTHVSDADVYLSAIEDSLSAEEFVVEFNQDKMDWSLSAHCWQIAEQNVCFDHLRGRKKTLEYALNGAKLNPAYWMEAFNVNPLPSVSLNTDVSFDVAGSWNGQGMPEATLDIKAPGTQVNVQKTGRTFTFDNFHLNAQSTSSSVNASLKMESNALGKIHVSADLAGDIGQPDVRGHALIEGIDLEYLASIDHNLDNLAGALVADLKFYQRGKDKGINGEINIVDGAISPSGVQVHFSDIQQTLAFKDKSAVLNGTFKLGNGHGGIDGSLNWDDQITGELTLKGDKLTFSDQQSITASFSPDIMVDLNTERLHVSGDVVIPAAEIVVETLPESAVSPSDDTIIVDANRRDQESLLPWSMDLNVQIDNARQKQVTVEAFGLTSAIAGDLRIKRETDATIATGQVSLIDGRYKAYGQNLIVRQGDLLFGGSVSQPQLAIEAIRDPLYTEDDVTAGLRISGFAQAPAVNVFSDPSLPQSEALSYLLRGRGLGSSGDSEDILLTNALLSFGLNKGEGVVNSIGSAVGIQDLNLNTSGQGDNTQLALSGTVAPGVTLSYGVGVFSSVSEVTLRYQVIPKLYLEAISGLNNAVDLYYQFTLDDSVTSTDQ